MTGIKLSNQNFLVQRTIQKSLHLHQRHFFLKKEVSQRKEETLTMCWLNSLTDIDLFLWLIVPIERFKYLLFPWKKSKHMIVEGLSNFLLAQHGKTWSSWNCHDKRIFELSKHKLVYLLKNFVRFVGSSFCAV